MHDPRESRFTCPRNRLWRGMTVLALAGAVGLAPIGCSDDTGSSAPSASSESASKAPKAPEKKPVEKAPAAPPTQEQLVERGKSVYMANCIACHSMNPAKDGALGPAVAGSSRDLVAARVLRAEYPEGYTPKRDSKAMIALPHLEPDIDALTAYLQSVD